MAQMVVERAFEGWRFHCWKIQRMRVIVCKWEHRRTNSAALAVFSAWSENVVGEAVQRKRSEAAAEVQALRNAMSAVATSHISEQAQLLCQAHSSEIDRLAEEHAATCSIGAWKY